MRVPVNTREPAFVESEIQTTYLAMFADANPEFVSEAFRQAMECFTGRYRNYLAIDARYHDFEHTLQGTLCMVRMLQGRERARAEPALTHRLFKLGLLAILFHDTGYLKTDDDREGTGAKYTLIHVDRSAEFAAALLSEQGYAQPDVLAVQNMIRCTGVNADLSAIPFQDELERTVGFALGTADLLGQMAADDYVEKLPILYTEFAEAQRYNDGKVPSRMVFASADDLMRKTPVFWEKYVQPKISRDFGGLYLFLGEFGPNGPNEYIDRIRANIERLQAQLPPRVA